MIFLRQKHYGNSNNSSRSSSHGGARRSASARTLSTSSRTNRAAGQHATIATTRSEACLNRNQSTTNSDVTSMDYLRSITINERLASIGGLFGALSIIITGALLYAIFTAKSSEKWYYIVAVLVNITLLMFLMLAAILFDRFYLRKIAARRQQAANAQSRQHRRRNQTSFFGFTTAASQPTNRVITVNPRPHTAIAVAAVADNRTSIRSNGTNDIPPDYPGLVDQNKPIVIQSISNNLETATRQLQPNKTSSSPSSSAQPPSYFDLYPSYSTSLQNDSHMSTINSTTNNNNTNQSDAVIVRLDCNKLTSTNINDNL